MSEKKEKIESELKTVKSLCETMEHAIKSEIDKGIERINTHELYEAVDVLKDLSEVKKNIIEGCYKMQIIEAMEEADEEKEKEEEYMLQRMKEEYGEDEGQRYYNAYRYANGRYAPKGRGSRRGYVRPMYDEMMYPYEYYRDMDRPDGRMYYNGSGSSGANTGGSSSMNSSGQSGNSSGNSNMSRGYSEGYNDGSSRGYEDGSRQGYDEGNRRGYEDGYNRGRSEGQRNTQRDMREGMSGQSRRGYMETKEAHPENTPEAKQKRMQKVDEYMNTLTNDVMEMIAGATPEEKNVFKNRMQTLQQKIV